MASNKKPRKAYRPRPVTAHTMTLATHFAAKPAAADCKEVLDMLHSAIKALREGVATEHQWSIAAGAVQVSMAVERQGIVRGLQEHLQSADECLQEIYDRALRAGGGHWVRVTLYYQELDALQTFQELHAFQMAQLGRAEFLAAVDVAQKKIKAQGNRPAVIREAERMAA